MRKLYFVFLVTSLGSRIVPRKTKSDENCPDIEFWQEQGIRSRPQGPNFHGMIFMIKTMEVYRFLKLIYSTNDI